MNRILKSTLFAQGILLVGCLSASALQYDQNVTPGVLYGSGNANGGWTIDTQNNIELGLRAHVRYPTPENTFNNSANVYSFADSSSISPANRGSWNYDFSIDVMGNAVLSDYTFQMAVDSDPGVGHTWNTFNPLLISDNEPSGSTTIAQNSENPGFAVVGIPGYDNSIAGSYDFVLSAYLGTTLEARTYIRVNVNGGTAGSGPFNGPLDVPDTGSTALLTLIGLAGVLEMVRLRQQRQTT